MRTFLVPLAFAVLLAPVAACARSGCCRPCAAPPACTPCGETRPAPPPPEPTPPSTPPPVATQEPRPASTVVLQVFAVSDLVRPDRGVEALAAKARELLPPGSMVAAQGTGTVVAKAPASSMSRFADWLASERRAAGTTEPKGAAPSPVPAPYDAPPSGLRLKYYDVHDLAGADDASARVLEESARAAVPHAYSVTMTHGVLIVRATVPEFDELDRWLGARRAAAR